MSQSKSLLLKLSMALALGITLPASSLWAADSAGEPGRSSIRQTLPMPLQLVHVEPGTMFIIMPKASPQSFRRQAKPSRRRHLMTLWVLQITQNIMVSCHV